MNRAPPLANTTVEERRNMIRFEAAVRNISEGLCMFDAESKLVICNERYASIYGLPTELTMPGTEHARIVEYRLAHDIDQVKLLGQSCHRVDRDGSYMLLGQGAIFGLARQRQPEQFQEYLNRQFLGNRGNEVATALAGDLVYEFIRKLADIILQCQRGFWREGLL